MIAPLIGRQHALGHNACAAQCEPIRLPFFMARLKKLMRSHFDDEARLMQTPAARCVDATTTSTRRSSICAITSMP